MFIVQWEGDGVFVGAFFHFIHKRSPDGYHTSTIHTYSTYLLEKLRTLWGRAELTAEQMIGHLLQHQIDLEQRLRRLEHLAPDPARAPERSLRQ